MNREDRERAKIFQKIDEINERILCGKYFREGRRDFLQTQDGRR